MLKGKNIILIAPAFFDYEIEIKNELEEQGAQVKYIDDRYRNSVFIKIALRLGLGGLFLGNKIEKYFLKEILNSKFEKVDFFLIVSPEGLTNSILRKIKLIYPYARYKLYMYDSFLNKKNAVKMIELCDTSFSFDPKDSLKHRVNHLPLFYIKSYEEINCTPIKYDLCFIGTAHSDRYTLVKEIERKLKSKNNFFYFYFQSILLFYYNKITNPSFKNIKPKDISYKILSKKDTIKAIAESKIIIDIHHPLQEGLTMRTIEMIGAKKKLITTNENIKGYDFFNPENILVINRNEPNIPLNFLNSNYQDLELPIYKKYSIESWISKIFESN